MSNDDNSPVEIDKLIHEPARLQIMTHLYVVEAADFLFLMRKTGLTWGNLSSHMTKLEEAEYIEVKKEFLDKKPHTVLKLTDIGRTAFEKYRGAIEKVFEDLPN
ncbi:MAG: transcriptional regulator [Candidatus Thorarchaeota archaeon]|nr:transcriptional regulator [Candidatus Thorarchaeota archaeon]